MSTQSPASWRLPAAPSPLPTALRLRAAGALRHASVMLDRWASRMSATAQRPADPGAPLEFHADAGAPEGGALYLDGRLVGWLDGVNRL
jgi:hypothetical protein